jgi:hypothetical protein
MQEHELDQLCFCDEYLLNAMEEDWKLAMKEIRKMDNRYLRISLDDIPILIADVRRMRRYLLTKSK